MYANSVSSPRFCLEESQGHVRTLGGQGYLCPMIGAEKILGDFSAFHFIKVHSKGNSSNGGPSAEMTMRVSNLSACSQFL